MNNYSKAVLLLYKSIYRYNGVEITMFAFQNNGQKFLSFSVHFL